MEELSSDQPSKSPSRATISVKVLKMVALSFVKTSPNFYVLPGCVEPHKVDQTILQWLVNRNVANEYEIQYPYVPENLMKNCIDLKDMMMPFGTR